MFAANNANDSLHKGTTFTVDDLSVGLASGVENLPGTGAGLETIYPNPSHNRADIIYNVAAFSKVSLTVYDALGREREVLLNQEQTSGKYKAELNTGGLSAGVYFARLLINGDSYNASFFVN
jgi:3',5'-cyclic AMP phosphodiesterase CpdA